jgi:hypothetical protein
MQMLRFSTSASSSESLDTVDLGESSLKAWSSTELIASRTFLHVQIKVFVVPKQRVSHPTDVHMTDVWK